MSEIPSESSTGVFHHQNLKVLNEKPTFAWRCKTNFKKNKSETSFGGKWKGIYKFGWIKPVTQAVRKYLRQYVQLNWMG